LTKLLETVDYTLVVMLFNVDVKLLPALTNYSWAHCKVTLETNLRRHRPTWART